MVGAKCKVSFGVPNSLVSVLGFERCIYDVGRHASENLINIMSVNSFLVHCNIIHSSYMRGTQSPGDYNFFPNAAPWQKILKAPHNLIYLPVTADVISTLSVWLNGSTRKSLGFTWRGIDYTFSSSQTLAVSMYSGYIERCHSTQERRNSLFSKRWNQR